jgi:hypothetical protein
MNGQSTVRSPTRFGQRASSKIILQPFSTTVSGWLLRLVRSLVAVENISENASDLISKHDAFSQSQVVRTHLHC